jgi:hypothetical protein
MYKFQLITIYSKQRHATEGCCLIMAVLVAGVMLYTIGRSSDHVTITNDSIDGFTNASSPVRTHRFWILQSIGPKAPLKPRASETSMFMSTAKNRGRRFGARSIVVRQLRAKTLV